jgi:hypothetical protein
MAKARATNLRSQDRRRLQSQAVSISAIGSVTSVSGKPWAPTSPWYSKNSKLARPCCKHPGGRTRLPNHHGFGNRVLS